jgi:cob(I)alamin adenosyltransferase
MSHRSIATKTGDDGTTSLLYGQRVAKTHPQIEAVGALDELNVALGAAKCAAADQTIKALLEGVQRNLIALMGEVSCAETDLPRWQDANFAKLDATALTEIETRITVLEAGGLKFDGWATPGANPTAIAFDTARVTARRAERRLLALPAHGRTPRPLLGAYLNRLSDLLWLLARAAEQPV